MTGGLWHGHNGRNGETQDAILARMLREARQQRTFVALPNIMQAGIAQHGARFNELRRRDFVIENELTRENGVIHSCYWLRFDPAEGR